MAYALGIDLGTTYTAAAVGRGADAQPLQLGVDAAQVPSVVLLREDGDFLVGDAAERRASAEPARAAREFKRRLGDAVPLIIGGTPFTVEALMAQQLRDIVQRATQQEGEAPALVVLTHPANYSDFKRNALLEAARLAGIEPGAVQLLTEPEAAAVAYSRQQRIEPGAVVAIYDFGGGTFDAALVRNTGTGFELVGVPEGMERLGGIDFDQAVLGHVDRSVDGLVSGADRSDPAVLPAQNRLRIECRRAKEALSNDADATIPVDLPGVHTSVRLTRDEFEQMVRPRVAETVTALQRAVASAGIGMDQVSRVLLVGGSSRMPVVAEMVRSATGRPVALDAHPKLAIATGAALVGGASTAALAPPPPPTAATAANAANAATPGAAWQPPTRAVDPVTQAPRRRTGLFVAVGAVVGIGAVAAFVLTSGSDDGAVATPTTPSTLVALTTTLAPAPVDTTVPVETTAPTTADSTPAASPFTVDRFAFGGAPGAGVPGRAVDAGVDRITAIAVDGSTTYVVDGGLRILRISDGAVELFATVDPAAVGIGGITVVGGTVYVTEARGVSSVIAGATVLVVDRGAAGMGSTPGPITHDGVGSLYFADADNHRIIRRGSDGSLSLVAGNGAVPAAGAHADDGSPATSAAIGAVSGLALDPTGRLLIGDATALAVRAITPDGVIDTVTVGGSISGVAVDAVGRVVLVDDAAGTVSRIESDGTATVLIRRVAGGAVVEGASTDQSSVGALGAAVQSPAGLLFVDDATVRIITG